MAGGRGGGSIPRMSTRRTGLRLEANAPPSLLYHVPTFLAALGHHRQREVGRKRNKTSTHAAHWTSQPRRGGRPVCSPRPGTPGADRKAAGPRLPPPRQWPEGRAKTSVQTPRPGRRAAGPPRPLQLSSGPADGARG